MGLGDGSQLLEKLRENDCTVDSVLDSQSLTLSFRSPAPGEQNWG